MLGITRRFRPSHPSIFGRQSNFTRQSNYGKSKSLLNVSRWNDKRSCHTSVMVLRPVHSTSTRVVGWKWKGNWVTLGTCSYGKRNYNTRRNRRWNMIRQSSDILTKLKTVVRIQFRCEINSIWVYFYHRYQAFMELRASAVAKKMEKNGKTSARLLAQCYLRCVAPGPGA